MNGPVHGSPSVKVPMNVSTNMNIWTNMNAPVHGSPSVNVRMTVPTNTNV